MHHLPRYPPPIRRPYPATSHRLRVLRHPVAAVHLVRESVGVRAPSLCGFQHFPGERVTGNCTLSATSRPARNPHQVAAPFQSLQWNRPPVKRHLATSRFSLAFRQMRQQHDTRHERQQQVPASRSTYFFLKEPPGAEGWTKMPVLDRRPSPPQPAEQHTAPQPLPLRAAAAASARRRNRGACPPLSRWE